MNDQRRAHRGAPRWLGFGFAVHTRLKNGCYNPHTYYQALTRKKENGTVEAIVVLGTKFVKVFRQIAVAGMIAGFGVFGAFADDGGSDGGHTDVRTAITMFQDQKAEFLAQQRDQQKSESRKVRGEVRDQLVASAKSISNQVRQEQKQQIEDAKRHAQEQSRKLLEETAEAARSSRHSQ